MATLFIPARNRLQWPDKEWKMGAITAQVTVQNTREPGKKIQMRAAVDTGAAYLTLPLAWRERLGEFEQVQTVEMETADQRVIQGYVCGPVKIQVEGFRAIHGEVAFIEMGPSDTDYDPLLGYLPLEASQIAVDMIGHRLVAVKYADLK